MCVFVHYVSHMLLVVCTCTGRGTKYGSGSYSKACKRPKGEIWFYNRTKLYEMKPDWQDKATAGLIKCAVLTNPASSHSDDVAY